MQNKIISFSLWGDNPKYTVGAVRNAELASEIYSGWICRFYVGISTPKTIIDELNLFPNVELVFKDGPCDWTSMFWRFETCDDADVDVSIFRDTDSRLNERERSAVESWLLSNKTFHIMRDHPFHGYPILGGMWGYKNLNRYNVKALIDSFDKSNNYGTDYQFFANVLYPLIGDDKIVHDEFFDQSPFPITRINTEFVGDVFDEYDQRHPEYYKYIIEKQ